MSVGAVILAAGMSTRMGRNKLLQKIGEEPLIARVVRIVAASPLDPILAVLGHQAVRTERVLTGFKCRIVYNAHYRDGLTTSIRAGIGNLPADCAGAMIVLGDMPWLTTHLIDRMLATFHTYGERSICVAAHNGRRGNPVLFARHYFPELLKLEGDIGARCVVVKNAAHVREVEAGDDGPLVDADTPDAFAAVCARLP